MCAACSQDRYTSQCTLRKKYVHVASVNFNESVSFYITFMRYSNKTVKNLYSKHSLNRLLFFLLCMALGPGVLRNFSTCAVKP